MQYRWQSARALLMVSILVLAMMISTPVQAASVVINGYALPWDQPPQMVNNRMLVPMRTFYEALGAQVDWDPANNTVTTRLDGTTIRLTIGSTSTTVNGQSSTLDVPAQTVNGRTMIPLRWVAENLGSSVLWLDELQTAVVRTSRPLNLKGDVGLTHSLLNPAFVFPFPTGSRYDDLYDSFGAGRDWSPSGTVSRSHEGIDIMSPKGTPIIAAADGVITNFGWNQLGGWRITYRVDGTTYSFYYAHLSRYAPGLGRGSRVRAGQLLGYVGDTGYGPEGTTGMFDPHLHFGIYDSTFKAVNAYPFLQFWQQNTKTVN